MIDPAASPTSCNPLIASPSAVVRRAPAYYLQTCIYDVIETKRQNIAKLSSWKDRIYKWKEWVFVGGDIFTTIYFGMQAAKTLHPALATSMHTSLRVCGALAGVINILVGLICFLNAYEEFRYGHNWLACRILLDAFCSTGIGLLVLSPYLIGLGCIAGFLATHPYMLPILFVAMNGPITIEVCKRLYELYTRTDYATQALATPAFLPTFTDKSYSKEEVIQHLSNLMEKMHDEMGAHVAVALFTLLNLQQFHPYRTREIEEAQAKLNEKLKEWLFAQWIRALQMFLCISSGVSSLSSRSLSIQSANNLGLMGTNFIPLWMDLFWPLRRNNPIPIPGIRESKQFD